MKVTIEHQDELDGDTMTASYQRRVVGDENLGTMIAEVIIALRVARPSQCVAAMIKRLAETGDICSNLSPRPEGGTPWIEVKLQEQQLTKAAKKLDGAWLIVDEESARISAGAAIK